jgi:hypothetical protein
VDKLWKKIDPKFILLERGDKMLITYFPNLFSIPVKCPPVIPGKKTGVYQ